ncbi:MAG: DegT/DnrJ/EryC1/StrS family aminotransferase, partial [Nitrosospira sp.]|nr:DegT/DnrJ/EryC1/StrS family aminotransferase [Nitrosospira sp.]
HRYYLVLPDLDKRTAFIAALRQKEIGTVFHYVPLDSSPMGEKYGRRSGTLTQTQQLSDRLVRLPLWLGLEEYQSEVIRHVAAEL